MQKENIGEKMNWWQQWKWFFKNNRDITEYRMSYNWSLEPVTYLRLKDPDKSMGEFPCRRNWIEKL